MKTLEDVIKFVNEYWEEIKNEGTRFDIDEWAYHCLNLDDTLTSTGDF